MRNCLILILTLLTISCSKEELEGDYNRPTNPISQTIYKTSVQNHEWNSGWYSLINDVFPIEFFSAYEYFDYDLDGDLDIFLRNDFHSGNATNTVNTLHVLLNDNGNWTEKENVVDYQTEKGYRKISTVDIDNDGDLDMIGFIAEDPYPGNGNRHMGGLDIFRFNNGIFYYEEIIPYQEGNGIWFHSGASADVNNDGWVDIIAGEGLVILNNGNGTFQTPYLLTENDPMGWFSQEIIDINNDGYNDLIVGKAHDGGTWYFPMGGTEELFGKTQWVYWGTPGYPYFDMESPYILPTNYDFYGTNDLYNLGLSSTMDISIVDFNRDGDLDIFCLSHSNIEPPFGDGTNAQLNVIEYYENNGDNTFTNKNDIFKNNENELPNSKTNYWKVWDFNGDGNLQIALEVEQYEFSHFKKGNDNKYTRGL